MKSNMFWWLSWVGGVLGMAVFLILLPEVDSLWRIAAVVFGFGCGLAITLISAGRLFQGDRRR